MPIIVSRHSRGLAGEASGSWDCCDEWVGVRRGGRTTGTVIGHGGRISVPVKLQAVARHRRGEAPGRGKLVIVLIDKVAIVVDDYDQAIEFFTGVLGFDLVEDSPSLTNDGRPKRWVVVRPPGAQTGILLARADGDRQAAAVGNQVAGRVGFFLQVDDFGAAYERMTAAGVEFRTVPRDEPYGRVAVFADIAGNLWDLIGPA
jgi:catechol 2,3-dioxygenase-like lactoylglutathione lyase family enzyme